MSKRIEPKCKNCRLYDQANGICRVAILAEGERYYMPVSPEDRCHFDELGIPVEQVRFWVEDPITHEKTSGDGVVKIEYPEGFFGNKEK